MESSPTEFCLIPRDYRQSNKLAIAIVSGVASCLSILGAGSILVYGITKRIVRNPEVRPLFHLAFADFLLAILWLAGVVMAERKQWEHCFYLDAVAEVFHLASFFLTVNYALNVYFRLKEKAFNIDVVQSSSVSSRNRHSWIFRVCYFLSWLLPVVVIAPLIHHGEEKIQGTTTCMRCLLLFDRPKSSEGHIWVHYGSGAMLASLVFSMVALVIFYFMTLRVYQKTVIQRGVLTDRERASIDELQQRILLYVLVFLFCWSPALVVATADLSPNTKITDLDNYLALFVLQGLSAPMQGFLNCLVYGWTRKGFRQATQRQRLLDSSPSMSRRSSYDAINSL